MRLGHIELFAADPLASMAFYRDLLGFQVTTVQADQYVWLHLNGQEFLLRPAEEGSVAIKAAGYNQATTGLVLYSDDLSTTISRLEEKGIDFVPLPDGCLSFVDPDGHWFQLVDPHHE